MSSSRSAGKRFSPRVSLSSKRWRNRRPGLQNGKRSLRFEPLEQRTLLSGSVTWAGAATPLVITSGNAPVQNDTLTIKLDAPQTHIVISDTNLANTYTIGANLIADGATGSGTNSLSIPLGAGAVTGATSINVNTGDGTDSLTVDLSNGNPSLSPYLNGIINDTSATGSKQLVVTESTLAAADTVSVTSTAISGTALGFTVNYSTGGSFAGGISVTTGTVADTVNVQSTVAGSTTTINTGGGNDTINVSSNAPTNTGNLAGLAGTLSIDGGAGSNTLNVSESGIAAADTVLVTSSQISSTVIPFTINYQATGGTFAGGINLTTGSGGDTVNVQSTLTGGTTAINTGAGNDTINVSSNAPTDTGNLAGLAGTLSIDGGAGSNTLNVSESGSATPDTVLVTNNQISSTVIPFTINYKATGGTFAGGINLTTGSGGDTLNIQSTQVSDPYSIKTGGGNDTVNISSDAPTNQGNLNGILGPINLDTQANTDTLNISDLSGPAAQTYSVTRVGATTQVQASGDALITYDATLGAGQLENFTLSGSTAGGNIYNINNTTATVSTTINDGTSSSSGDSTWNIKGDNLSASNSFYGFGGDDRFFLNIATNPGSGAGVTAALASLLIDGGLGVGGAPNTSANRDQLIVNDNSGTARTLNFQYADPTKSAGNLDLQGFPILPAPGIQVLNMETLNFNAAAN
ncbi:MAG: hypothetical protein ABR915_23145, partial [Thermoguttaceae bacterium]